MFIMLSYYIFNVWSICFYLPHLIYLTAVYLCILCFIFINHARDLSGFLFFYRTSLHICSLAYSLLFLYLVFLSLHFLLLCCYFYCSLSWMLRSVIRHFSSFLLIMYEFKAVDLICSMFIILSSTYMLISTVISSLTRRLFRRCSYFCNF